MPVFQRKQLRQDLGILRLRQTIVGTTSLSLGANASLAVLDRRYAVPDLSGQDLYSRAWIRVASENYQVGSFNTGSGAWVGLTPVINAIASGADFEIHEKLDPDELDRALDETILTLPLRREVGLRTVDGATFYTLDGAASPNTIRTVLAVYYFANPDASLNRDRRDLVEHEIVTTPTGMELRITRGLAASQQIILDAHLTLSLGAGDAATINLPDRETVLWGAAARCYDLLIQKSPGQFEGAYRQRRAEAAKAFSVLARRHFPETFKELTLSPRGPLDDWWNS